LLENKKIAYTLLTIYWIVLFIGTTLPGQSLPSFGGVDKVKHFGGYLGLTVLLYITLLFQDKYKALKDHAAGAAFIIIAFYGILDELHQMLVPGRSADVLDWVADVAGVIIGLLFVKIFLKNRLHPQVKQRANPTFD
jgi:VanZ family protein